MKQFHLLAAALLCAVTSPFARGESLTETISLTFSESDFSITTGADGLTHIESLREIASYSNDTSLPALPYFSVNLKVPAESNYKTCNIQCEQHLLMSDVLIAPNTEPVPTGTQLPVTQNTTDKAPAYSPALYPTSSFNYVATSRTDEYSLVHFRYTPFIYDAAKKELYFVDSYDVTVNIDAPAENSLSQATENSMMVKHNLAAGIERAIPVESDNRLYLIITNEALKSAFEPLRKWKEIKGFDAKIATVESIYQTNSSDDKPLQIKKYIAKQKINGLEYVLLGGDDQVVPVRYAFARGKGTSSQDIIPADLYYGCLDSKSFDWNLNKDGSYGTFADSISLVPSVYVTRVPARTPEDVTAFVNKLLKYEKNPTYHNKMLTAGTVVGGYIPEPTSINEPITSVHHSDSEVQSTVMYNNYIMPYWNGQRDMLFDTNTSFAGERDYQMDAEHFANHLSKGYDFVSVNCHGYVNQWIFWEATYWNPETHAPHKVNSTVYNNELAQGLTNSSSTIITTTACDTNGFDYPNGYELTGGRKYPSLSEVLIRSPHSGVIAYLGSSREGWGFIGNNLGPSNQYEALFYKYLFSDDIKDKNFGRLVAKAKMDKIADAMVYSSYDYNLYRWLQFSINPIGDPEMPIFTETPKTFDNLSITINGRTVKVSTGVDDCRVCITGINISMPQYQYGNRFFTFDYVPEQFYVCATKQNYIPKVYTVSAQANGQMKMAEVKSIDQLMEKDMGVGRLAQPDNKILGCTPNPSGDIATINTQIEEESASASLVFTSLMGNKEKEVEIPAGETSVTTSVAALPSGIHLVSLIVNGRVCDSYRLVKK